MYIYHTAPEYLFFNVLVGISNIILREYDHISVRMFDHLFMKECRYGGAIECMITFTTVIAQTGIPTIVIVNKQ